MITRRGFLAGSALTAAVAGVAVSAVWPGFQASVATHRQRVARGSMLIGTSFGDVEYALAGRGDYVLMIHGSGGGFDQAIDNSALLQTSGFQIIAPSRFGYLRSSNPAGATPEMQADAYAALLDHLGVSRVAAVAFSAG